MNIVVVLSDEHAAATAGCYGHPSVQTPNLDRLSDDGWTFDNAYCTSPMCVPSRLSLLSGRYVHEVGAWDNGVVPSRPVYRTWADYLRPAGYECVLAGRTHFNGPDRLLGFDRRLSDDLDFWIDHSGRPPRRTADWRRPSNSHVSECGPGDHVHTRHDAATTDLAVDFLHSRTPGGRPFLLYVGYMHPHFPLVAPPEFAARYDPAEVELPATWQEPVEEQHPVIAQLRKGFRNDAPLPEALARQATAAYWALVTHLDHQLGRLLAAVDDDTVVLYTSDHGEMGGQHGIWQKQCFYEPAVRVPLILRLPGRAPTRVAEPVSLVDVLPTLLDVAGVDQPAELPGRSLLRPSAADRAVFSEYHAQGMVNGGFMVRKGRYKYCAYVGAEPQLFDLEADPDECTDVASDPAFAAVREDMHRELLRIADPVAVDARAKSDQAERTGQS